MAYRYDSDLEFLKRLSSSDLKDLFDVLVYGKDGQIRDTQELTYSEEYKKYGNNYAKYAERIAEELQHYGGNTFANLFRSEGVLYKEILCDVCKYLKVNHNKNSETSLIEENMLRQVLEKRLEKMSDEEKREVGRELEIKNIDNLSKQAMNVALLGLLKTNDLHAYQLAMSVANAVVGKTLGGGLTAVAGKVALKKTLGVLAGPIGWAITGALVSVSLAGPAYRVTVPACFVIAALRRKPKQINKAKTNNNKGGKWIFIFIFLVILVIASSVIFFIKREHQPSNNASNNQPSAIQKIDAKNPNSKNHKKSNSHSKVQNQAQKQ